MDFHFTVLAIEFLNRIRFEWNGKRTFILKQFLFGSFSGLNGYALLSNTGSKGRLMNMTFDRGVVMFIDAVEGFKW